MTRTMVACVALATMWSAAPAQENAATVVEAKAAPATIRCLGFEVLVAGDANADAVVKARFRKAGDEQWREALPLLRVNPEAMVRPPAEGRSFFAGSILDLEPGTGYEVELTLADPDGGEWSKAFSCTTRIEPVAPAPVRTLYVVPGDGGGSGTEADPFKGLDAANAAARPGDMVLVGGGTYSAPARLSASGKPGKPIIWRARTGETPVVDGTRPGNDERSARGVDVVDTSDVWVEGFEVRNCEYGVVAHRAQRFVLRRSNIHSVDYGFTSTGGTPYAADHFLADNVVAGPCTWPRTKGIEDPRGFQVSGTGHVVCFNRVTGFADGIDTFGERDRRRTEYCSDIDIYGNEISEMTDDGIECDYSQTNVRCFDNRLTNVFQGISEQPVNGGPVYIYRNAIYNIGIEPFKMHTAGEPLTSGFYLFHNTCVKRGIPWMVWSRQARANNIMARNNLFIGSPVTQEGEPTQYAFDFTVQTEKCDFDYDGFGGGPFAKFARWMPGVYPTIEDVRKDAPVEKHAVMVDADKVFASGVKAPADINTQYGVEVNDLRLAPGSAAVDAGVPVPNVNDGYLVRAPDLGAYELGKPLPHYGPRE